MFIRETVKSKKGKKYIQHQLVESVRTPNGPRQRLLLNMGLLDLAKDQWKDLANAIESEFHGQENLFGNEIISTERMRNLHALSEIKGDFICSVYEIPYSIQLFSSRRLFFSFSFVVGPFILLTGYPISVLIFNHNYLNI